MLHFAENPVPAAPAIPISTGQSLLLGVFMCSAEHGGALTSHRASRGLGKAEAHHGRAQEKPRKANSVPHEADQSLPSTLPHTHSSVAR